MAWEMAQQLPAAGAEVGLVAMLDTSIPARATGRDAGPRAGDAAHRGRPGGVGGGLVARVETTAPPAAARAGAGEAVRQVRLKALPESRVDEILALTAVRAPTCARW